MAYSTQQKHAVESVIEKASRPLTPVEICAEAQKEMPGLGIATVYRALKQFVQEGRARLVEVPGISPHYESAARHHHHFFFCQSCEHLFNLAGCVPGLDRMAPRGFKVKRHEIVLFGDCKKCSAA